MSDGHVLRQAAGKPAISRLGQRVKPRRDDSAKADPPNLVHEWVLAGIVAAAARLTPIPMLDDYVRGQCRKLVVSRTLHAYQPEMSMELFKPLYESPSGWTASFTKQLLYLPGRLLLYPIRKLVLLMVSVRTVPLDVMQMVLMGRTLQRYLESGRIASDKSFSPVMAARMQAAFDESFRRMDLHVARAAVHDALAGVTGWQAAASELFRHVTCPSPTPVGDWHPVPTVERSAERIQEVIDRPETRRLFSRFDRRFDRAMERRRVERSLAER